MENCEGIEEDIEQMGYPEGMVRTFHDSRRGEDIND
jgi:hypothetical protein